MRTCIVCKLDLPEDRFYKKKLLKDGLDKKCKKCRADTSRHFYHNNPHTKMMIRSKKVRKKFGLTLEQYIEIKKSPCEICKKHYDKICIDHCHKTNEYRGALCDNCNKALGLFRDDVERFKNAIEYLNKFEERMKLHVKKVRSSTTPST